MVLAGDIGGTKTVLALYSEERGPHRPVHESRYESDDHPSLATIISHFLEMTGTQPLLATFGVAGPVHDRKVQVTNLPWVVDGRVLETLLGGSPVYLLNDLEAIAYSIPTLESGDVEVIKPGQPSADGPIAIIAPGTGLGEAYLFWDGQGYRPIASEGGHTDFAPATPLELELLDYLMPRLGHVSYERVCSGVGIPNLYAFLRDTGKYEEPSWLQAELDEAEDPAPVIFQAALGRAAEICTATLDLFMAILGSEAGNLVLQVLATGGVYLGGGIPPRIIPQLRGQTFLEAFARKGRLTRLLLDVPVFVITNPNAALLGSANHGLSRLAKKDFGKEPL